MALLKERLDCKQKSDNKAVIVSDGAVAMVTVYNYIW
jgi:hypothetical protein